MTNAELRSLIPNVIHEVEGETLLIDKLAPWIDSASSWLAVNIVGESFSLPESLLPGAKKIIVYKAFAEAIPSLDLTLSPAGFAVINTDGRAPASKERVERLVDSLRDYVEANLPPFLASLLRLADWRSSAMGEYWLDTFMLGLDDAQEHKRDKDLLTTYKLMRESALRFQSILAQDYLGKNLLSALRSAVYEPEPDERSAVWHLLNRAILQYITREERGLMTQDEHSLSHYAWHHAQPILLELRGCEPLYRIWEAEMADKLKVEPFKNTVKGGFFF